MITVNDEPMDWEEGLTISEIIKRKEITFPMLVVKVNGKMVSKDDYDTTVVEDNSDINIIYIHAGG